MGYGSVTVTSGTAVQVVPANTQRLSLIISNNGNYFTYLGPDSSVTSTTGIAVDSGSSYYEDSGGQRTYLGAYYAIAENSTNKVSYWERER
jgi:hypothetical protein